jgi:hypothetical protein
MDPDSEAADGDGAALASVTVRLVDRLSGVSVTWFGARSADGTGTRAERLRELVVALAELGPQAGNGAPAGVVPAPLRPHGLADQITVLVDEIRHGSAAHEVLVGVLNEATAAVQACYDALWLPALG